MSKLTVGASIAWQIAAIEAATLKSQYIENYHLLIGVLSLKKVIDHENENRRDNQGKQLIIGEYKAIETALLTFGLDSTTLRRQVRKKLMKGNFEHTEKVIHRSQDCKHIFSRADKLVARARVVSSLHLLAAIMEAPTDIIRSVLEQAGVSPADVGVLALKFAVQGDTEYLERYGRDLTREARDGKIGPFVGRRNEILQVVRTLARRNKNNPVLVGEAGVGKTAIVEALADRIAQGKDPQILSGKRLIELSLGALMGGTKFRGEFEERLTRIIEETQTHPEVILFIDELHNMVGAGRIDGAMDAANLLKPALARGDIRCIGATTIREYRRYIESDPALERRFDKIIVNEANPEETIEILKGIRPKWEEHHQVPITDRALEAAVNLSIRFDCDHQLPDKAIDLVDKAAARTRVPFLSMWEEKRQDVRSIKKDNVFESGPEVTELTIAQVLSEKIGVPLEVITGQIDGMSRSRLLEMEPSLKKRLVGQDGAISGVCQRLLMAHAGIGKRRGPLAVFLFLGPTGVGKTELARLLAEFLFGSVSSIIRFDMSEYMEKHSAAKLIGSPPGYVGYEEEGQLTSKLRTKPYAVVLLDEIEKAHPMVFDIFLQVFDEGRLTDSKGRTADARNAIFIMTSNITSNKSMKQMGFQAHPLTNSDITLDEIKKRFRPEFINRIDESIIFRSLNKKDLGKILKPMLDGIIETIKKEYQVDLYIDDEVDNFIIMNGYSPEYGVRELRRTVEKLIQNPLSDLIISGNIKDYKSWKCMCIDKTISFLPIIGS